MSEQEKTSPAHPERIIGFIKLQVADALLDTDLFPAGEPSGGESASVLFALGLLSAVPDRKSVV